MNEEEEEEQAVTRGKKKTTVSCVPFPAVCSALSVFGCAGYQCSVVCGAGFGYSWIG